MTALGFLLLFVGAVLVVAEAHIPGGVLGVMGGLALMFGGIVVIAALGGGALVAIPVAIGIVTATGAWTMIAARKVARARRAEIRAGSETLCGRIGVVRGWHEPEGRVFVDGALWRAHHGWLDREKDSLEEGDPVVVEGVQGLTLVVRRAEDWELIT